ncbi:glycoside hydrolase family 6 protein [Streptomyces sp. NPDC058572]|uniref:glycoside hydrolase family 6 protein n=1 Tax=Streptomyces sp. NPDC058572 TaxID=3346546 RepID=UPI003663DEA7
MSGVRTQRRAERTAGRRAARRRAMVAAASAVVAAAAAAGVLSQTSRDGGTERAAPSVARTTAPAPLPVRPSPTPTPPKPSASPSRAPEPSRSAAPRPVRTRTAAAALYRHPGSQVLDWVRAHRSDPRRSVIEARIAAQPSAVWFTEYDPGAVTGKVRSVTSAAAAANRTAVLVAYAIPDRDCGGASEGGAPDLGAYDRWIGEFAAGLGDRPVLVILEPDSIAQADCLSAGQRSARFAALGRAARTLKAANPRAKVYFDAGHSGWHPVAEQAAALRSAEAGTSGDGIFTNVSNFHGTAEEVAYARRVLAALGGRPGLGAVIDTSRNGNGAPSAGQWCDPDGRAIGRAPTTDTGEADIDAYLWVKLPGESDGCKGGAGSFSPEYAYELATG